MQALAINRSLTGVMSDKNMWLVGKSFDRSMDKRLGPRPCPAVEDTVFKQVFCRRYDACLDKAARENWPQFTCRGCQELGNTTAMRPSPRELRGCYCLLHKLFIGKSK